MFVMARHDPSDDRYLAIVVAANHVITAAILFYSNMTLGALLQKKHIDNTLVLINSQKLKVREFSLGRWSQSPRGEKDKTMRWFNVILIFPRSSGKQQFTVIQSNFPQANTLRTKRSVCLEEMSANGLEGGGGGGKNVVLACSRL